MAILGGAAFALSTTDEAEPAFASALARGVNHLDIAPRYGQAERAVGPLVPPVRDRIEDIYWFAIKVAFFMYLYIWYRATFPRYRFDQLMHLGWKFMIPVGIAVLILTAALGLGS